MFIVVGIGTEIGKTVISAILVEALEADYWKPVQSGNESKTDTQTVAELVTPLASRTFHAEAYSFKAPLSPHAAAEVEHTVINPAKLTLPTTSRPLVVELAGGLLVPITYQYLNVHLVKDLGLPVVIVSRYYLGSINHTLLTVEVLKKYEIHMLGIIFNGEPVPASRQAIVGFAQVPILGEVPYYEELGAENIRFEAEKLRKNFVI